MSKSGNKIISLSPSITDLSKYQIYDWTLEMLEEEAARIYPVITPPAEISVDDGALGRASAW